MELIQAPESQVEFSIRPLQESGLIKLRIHTPMRPSAQQVRPSRLSTIVTPVTTCGNPITDIRDNKTYQTVKIGNQCWMAEDLNYGTEISSNMDQRDNCTPEKYHNPASSIQHPASVYQWDEIMNYDEFISQHRALPSGLACSFRS